MLRNPFKQTGTISNCLEIFLCTSSDKVALVLRQCIDVSRIYVLVIMLDYVVLRKSSQNHGV